MQLPAHFNATTLASLFIFSCSPLIILIACQICPDDNLAIHACVDVRVRDSNIIKTKEMTRVKMDVLPAPLPRFQKPRLRNTFGFANHSFLLHGKIVHCQHFDSILGIGLIENAQSLGQLRAGSFHVESNQFPSRSDFQSDKSIDGPNPSLILIGSWSQLPDILFAAVVRISSSARLMAVCTHTRWKIHNMRASGRGENDLHLTRVRASESASLTTVWPLLSQRQVK